MTEYDCIRMTPSAPGPQKGILCYYLVLRPEICFNLIFGLYLFSVLEVRKLFSKLKFFSSVL